MHRDDFLIKSINSYKVLIDNQAYLIREDSKGNRVKYSVGDNGDVIELTIQVKQNTENIAKKVDKEDGKSLVENSDIQKLKTLENYNDSQVKTDITNLTKDKADKSELNKYVTSEYANQTYATKNDLSTIPGFKKIVADTLPTENIDNEAVYFIKLSTTEDKNIFNEYIRVENKWEMLGTSQVNLDGYATTKDLANYATKDELPVIDPQTTIAGNDFNTGNNLVKLENGKIPTNLYEKNKMWKGTQQQYDAITTKDPDTFYFITE